MLAGRAAAAAAARGGATRQHSGQQPLTEANLFSRIARIFKSYANAAGAACADARLCARRLPTVRRLLA